MRIFKSKWFQRFAKKEGLTDSALFEVVYRANCGQIDADLGGEVIKQRIARSDHGRSKGYRTIILFRRGTKAFFVYGFSKSQRDNVDADEVKQFKIAAKRVLALTNLQLAEQLKLGNFIEVKAQ